MFKISWLHLHYDFYRTERTTIVAQHRFSLVCENQKIKTKLVCPRLKMGTKMHTKN